MARGDTVIIKSSSGKSSVVLSEPQWDLNGEGQSLQIRLASDSVSGAKRIWAYKDFRELTKFFQGLANTWKGWDGERTYSSIEEDFTLIATADKLGHGYIKARLWSHLSFDLTIYLRLDSGQYGVIASQLNNLIKGD